MPQEIDFGRRGRSIDARKRARRLREALSVIALLSLASLVCIGLYLGLILFFSGG